MINILTFYSRTVDKSFDLD